MFDKTDVESENRYIQFFITDILEIYRISEFNQMLSLFWQELRPIVLQFECPSAKQNQLRPDIRIILYSYIVFSK